VKPDLVAVALALLIIGLSVKGTMFSRVQHRRTYWRIKLRLHPGHGFASCAELAGAGPAWPPSGTASESAPTCPGGPG
jgi:hypothetical protein